MVACLALDAMGGGCSPKTGSPRHALLILLDAARADRLSCYGYGRATTPRLDSLAADGIVFLNHYTQGTYTPTALPSLLFSRYYIQPLPSFTEKVALTSPEDLFSAPDEESISLPRALSLAGFRTIMISAHGWLKPVTAFAGEFGETHDLSATVPVDRRYGHPRADQVIDDAIRWIQENRSREFFVYLHLMDTHFPHYLEAEAREFLDAAGYSGGPPDTFTDTGRPKDTSAALSERERIYLDALYDGGLRYTDRQIGRLLDFLDRESIRPLVAVTSDHGEFLLDQPGRFAHAGLWYEALARVPLILSWPGKLDPGRVTGFTEAVDLVPTMLRLLDVSLPAGKRPDGSDLGETLRGTGFSRDHVFMRRAVRSGRYKCLFRSDDDILLAEREPGVAAISGLLYDLQSDPAETADLWTGHAELAREMLLAYRYRMARPYRRYLEARTTAQPRDPFAIQVKHLYASPQVRATVQAMKEWDRLAASPSPPEGWSTGPAWSYLMAARGAASLAFELPLPDGRYVLSMAIRGRCALRMPGDDPAADVTWLEGRPFDRRDTSPWRTDQVVFGVVEVKGQVFTATILPDTLASPLLIEYFGFRPLGGEGMKMLDKQEEEELLKRLKALGYLG